METKPRLLDRVSQIAAGPGDIERRVQVAEEAILGERRRFTSSAAGRIQWNWYMGQLAQDIGLERSRLVRSVGRRTKPGEAAPEHIIELFDRLTPQILALKEADEGSK